MTASKLNVAQDGSADRLLRVKDLRTSFRTADGTVQAVNGVDFSVRQGEIVGVVGESGSGKSVLHLTILGLIRCPPGSIDSGSVEFEGQDLLKAPGRTMRRIRGNRISMVFQDPMTSLNPFLTIGDQVAEPLVVHARMRQREARLRALELLEEVGIPDPAGRIDHYPHQFSGGMRQRVMIAMALAMNPRLLIADEPTTALDVTIQAQILTLLRRIRDDHGTAIIFVTHDLGVVANFCERVEVMYAGRIVESGGTRELFSEPFHPYTQALLRSSPRLDDPGQGPLYSIPGRPPDLLQPPSGCAFHPRCSHVLERCRYEPPPLRHESEDKLPQGHCRRVRCFLTVLPDEADSDPASSTSHESGKAP